MMRSINFFAKRPILDVWLGSEYVYETNVLNIHNKQAKHENKANWHNFAHIS